MNYFLKRFFLIILFFAQLKVYSNNRNKVELDYLGSYYFDNYELKGNYLDDILLFRIDYCRHLSKDNRHGVFINLGHNHNRYYSKGNSIFSQFENTYLERESYFISTGYTYDFCRTKHLDVGLQTAFNFRIKSYNELLVKTYFDNSEIIVQYLEFNQSPGISLGFHGGVHISWKWMLESNVDMIRYFNNKLIQSKSTGLNIKDPQENTLLIGLGISYSF
jgi:hypothetical protein